ncbi:phage tail protein [Peptoniphilus harei]|uniref:phage tail-collar fiber domain-containing protein n=1 Tax=Peptoniphilus harei TaxID=54005 RepID=UPI00254EBBCF|nr:phage tail protein [Peptoniphilus harei]MDK7354975.1 phage tail protein [Peptoniphilus harei]MDK7370623.1 phage tail protein [Peptoniphilus harei]
MVNNQSFLTKKGMDLMAYCQTGEPLAITKFKIGKGKIDSLGELLVLDDLKDPTLEGAITNVKSNGDGTATISVVITNDKLEKGFYISEVGLFAEDPRYGEILYAAMSTDEHPDFIPAGSQNNPGFELRIDFEVVIENASNITLNINRSMTFVTWEQFWGLAGEGRTNQTVKGNWDLIKDLELRLLAIGTGQVSNIKNNQFKVSFSPLSESEEFEGIYDAKMQRLVI